ncbi:nuclear transport factor 2 family protein [Aliagarivorans marinus]|uniref:nuclear transport factor 2 family protein n=1 Tax=Aliagarivorans marinus TaxID=561965 RepID=UPI0004148B1D|nr:nuclear transport factor 2 family protein [Aliagarivorans marinus]
MLSAIKQDSNDDLVSKVQAFYSDLTSDSLTQLGELYAQDALFQDPLHQLEGLAAIKHYFAGMLSNCEYCRFEFEEALVDGQQACLPWVMRLRHPKLNGGEEFSVTGLSRLKFAGKVYYHRDYFDVSEMLHDQLPLVGRLSRALKHRAAGL